MIKDESLYIAGPLCFYPTGYNMWQSWRLEAQFYGFTVSLPNDTKPEFEEGNKRSLSAAIFRNCRDSINKTTGVIANLENYRGFNPDGGTVYEIGMAYGKGCKCYAYTRDKRPEKMKYGAAVYKGDKLYDLEGRELKDLPFGPCIMGACKVVEGGFSDALKAYMTDIEEESRLKANRYVKITKEAPKMTMPRGDKPIVYLASFERNDSDAAEKFEKMKEICAKYGLLAITPMDSAPGVPDIETDDLYEKTYNTFDRWQQHVRNCDIILANLNDYRSGYEPNDDVAFECGMAFQLGKKLYGYADNIGPMVDRVPSRLVGDRVRDANDMDVENFEAACNLMFCASYKMLDGSFEDVVRKMAEDLKDFKLPDDLVPAIVD